MPLPRLRTKETHKSDRRMIENALKNFFSVSSFRNWDNLHNGRAGTCFRPMICHRLPCKLNRVNFNHQGAPFRSEARPWRYRAASLPHKPHWLQLTAALAIDPVKMHWLEPLGGQTRRLTVATVVQRVHRTGQAVEEYEWFVEYNVCRLFALLKKDFSLSTSWSEISVLGPSEVLNS